VINQCQPKENSMKYAKAGNSLIRRFVQSILLFSAFSFSLFSSADIQLKFTDGKKFSDYELTGQTRTKSLETLERDLNKLLSKISADYLGEKQSLEIEVTNIDLPGIYHFSYGPQGQDMRVVRSNTPYKLYFNYILKDEAGKVIKNGESKIKEFYDSNIASRIKSNRGALSYYEKPLEKWFEKTLSE